MFLFEDAFLREDVEQAQRRNHQEHRGTRVLAVGAVVTMIWAWGWAQYPYLLPTVQKISEGAANDSTLVSVLITFGAAVLLVIPSLGLLYVLSQKSVLEEEH